MGHCPFHDTRSVAALVSRAWSEYRCFAHGCDRRRRQYEKLNLALRRTENKVHNVFTFTLGVCNL